MQILELSGTWQLRQAGKQDIVPVKVPGNVHTDLLTAGKIPDPYYRDNESRLQWIGEADWIYSREFDIPQDVLNHDSVFLRCEGLDTSASIKINSKAVAKTDNMFRTWEFDVKKFLKPGKNLIEVRFASVIPYINRREKERHMPAWKGPKDVQGGGWVRKEQCNFGWDWGPVLVTCGIWRPISLVAYNTARLQDIYITQKHDGNNVSIYIDIYIDSYLLKSSGIAAAVTVSGGGKRRSVEASFKGNKTRISLSIDNPELWWPNGMGAQPLYDVNIELKEGGKVIDTIHKRIGLRTLKLERKKDKWGESFAFNVNGVTFFAKGADWIPAATFATSVSRMDYKDLIQSAADCNMNMLRVWGGGIYEDDVFYDLCDELGICVWQDFMFGCSAYPVFDDVWLQNFLAEAEDNIKRLRHHSCIALWCGNNELEQGIMADKWDENHMSWDDYKKLFDDLLPAVVKKLDPARDYWPCSPHKPHGDRANFHDERWGDAHLWQVWHGRQPFEWYRTSFHRFVSEFGFQSFPEPKTTHNYTEPQDRNITSYVMEHHQRSLIGNGAIMTYMLDWFRLPKDFDSTLWLSQILQALAMKYAVEHWRRNMPRCMGALYWQLNDCWPVASWSSIDYHHRWKALQYTAKRFYAPLLVSGVENNARGTVELYVTSDLLAVKSGTLSWNVTDVAGNSLLKGQKAVEIAPRHSGRVETLHLANLLKEYGERNIMVWMELTTGRKTASSNLVSFIKPKHMELLDPKFQYTVGEGGKGEAVVTITVKAAALYTWLELESIDARFSDNFSHILPGKPIDIICTPAKHLKITEIRDRLRIRSLYDTYA